MVCQKKDGIMDIKNVRSDFVIALWLAFLLYLAGMTYFMADVQFRLGHIEHYMMHQSYNKESGFYCPEMGD